MTTKNIDKSHNKNELSSIQTKFMDCLLGEENDFLESIESSGNITVAKRLHIYKHAFSARFIEAIETDHPILGTYLGDDLFDRMVKGYIEAVPSTFTSLRQYADALPSYLAKKAPFSEHPIISEIAHFERLLLSSFDAKDEASIDFARLTELEPEKWPDLVLRFHPSLQVFNCQWNSVEAWQAIKRDENPPEAIKQKGICWLIWRNQDRLTQFRSIEKIEYEVLNAFIKGDTFSTICENLIGQIPDNEIPERTISLIKPWFDNHIIIRL